MLGKKIENSGKVVIKRGEPGAMVMHGVEKLNGHDLNVTYCVTSVSDPSVGTVVVQHILYGEVLIFIVVPPPAPCDIGVYWKVYNAK